ncbi:hypothetical protein [Amycolatopsis sp. NPDC051716]|uniref:hypothetical protein n=1 Tax=Amycolatopsis sp. NPDC051716 TaxID=3155804 RepID=UPI0034337BEC
MLNRLPKTVPYRMDRRLGDRVAETAPIVSTTRLARRIIDDMHAEFAPGIYAGRAFGANAWVYRGRWIDFEVFGFLGKELRDPEFVDAARQEFESFVDSYDWRMAEGPSVHRFEGRRVILCDEAKRVFRNATGRVWVYRRWRALAGPRFRPFLPLDQS